MAKRQEKPFLPTERVNGVNGNFTTVSLPISRELYSEMRLLAATENKRAIHVLRALAAQWVAAKKKEANRAA